MSETHAGEITSNEFQAQTEHINQLVEKVNSIVDEGARATSLELLQSLMDLHGAAMFRVVELLTGSEAGRASLTKLGDDPLICGLLVLYGIHPLPLEERVARAVERVRGQLHKQGGSVELIGVIDSLVQVKIESSGHGCGSSTDAFKRTVEQAILECAPEVVEVQSPNLTAPAAGFVSLEALRTSSSQPSSNQPPSIQPASSQTSTNHASVVKEEKKYEESAA
jgi:Fe-S cluster biogenesis protein NfuA